MIQSISREKNDAVLIYHHVTDYGVLMVIANQTIFSPYQEHNSHSSKWNKNGCSHRRKWRILSQCVFAQCSFC